MDLCPLRTTKLITASRANPERPRLHLLGHSWGGMLAIHDAIPGSIRELFEFSAHMTYLTETEKYCRVPADWLAAGARGGLKAP